MSKLIFRVRREYNIIAKYWYFDLFFLLFDKIVRKKRTFSKIMLLSFTGMIFVGSTIFGIVKYNLNHSNKTESKVSLLEKQIKDLETKNKTMASKVEEISVVKEAVAAYEKGFNDYQNKNYQNVIEKFKISYTLDSTNYSSDDTLYYLILAEQKVKDQANVNPYASEFASKKNEFFTKSPYYDDIILMKAEWLIKENRKEDAIKILNEIVKDFSKKWTANKAKRLLDGLNK
jgi:hypothetical protein